MKARIINGKEIAQKVRRSIKERVDTLKEQKGIVPGLTVILVGDDPASQIYVRNKARACQEVGIRSDVIRLDVNTTEDELLEYIKRLNADDQVHGILVQLPLPSH